MEQTSTDSCQPPRPRAYSRQDLNPSKWDPQCQIRSPFPLGSFWPVYVGNFWCDDFSQLATKVQEYFALKGLLARMVFSRCLKDDPHFTHATEANVYDCLVYFVRQQDADDAISYCHREKCYGHRLNVFPGRTPVYFDQSKSVHHTLVQEHKLGVTGQVFEQHVHGIASARVDCVVMQTFKDFLVQYASVDDRDNAIRKTRIFTVNKLPDGQAMQRFLEQDVSQELFERIRIDPSFLQQLPPDRILNPLLSGSIPVLSNTWKTTNMVKMPQMNPRLYTRNGINEMKTKRSAERALSLFGIVCDYHTPVPYEVKQARKERKKERKQQRRLEKSAGGSTAKAKGEKHRPRKYYTQFIEQLASAARSDNQN